MKIKYFHGTDTLHIEFRTAPATETGDLDENTLLDVDAAVACVVALTAALRGDWRLLRGCLASQLNCQSSP